MIADGGWAEDGLLYPSRLSALSALSALSGPCHAVNPTTKLEGCAKDQRHEAAKVIH